MAEDIDSRVSVAWTRRCYECDRGDLNDAHNNLAICEASGIGKSWLACALRQKACRDERCVLYQCLPRLFANLALCPGPDRHARLQRTLGDVKLVKLDDRGLRPLLLSYHQSASRRGLARSDQQSDLSRCHP